MLQKNWLILCFLLVVIVLVNVLWKPTRVQEGIDSNINYYAFTRMNKKSASNVNKQKSNLGSRLNIVRYTSPTPNSRSDYLQQLMLLQRIVKKMDNDNAKFLSVFFEDGFVINEPELNRKLERIVNDLGEKEYDFLLLGGNPNMQGEMVKDGVYKINNETPFTNVYGYVISNMNLDNMMSKIKKARGRSLLDKIHILAKRGDVVIMGLYPALVTGLVL